MDFEKQCKVLPWSFLHLSEKVRAALRLARSELKTLVRSLIVIPRREIKMEKSVLKFQMIPRCPEANLALPKMDEKGLVPGNGFV